MTLLPWVAEAQLGKKIGDRVVRNAENRVEQKATQKANRAVDKTIDTVDKGATDAVTGKNKKEKEEKDKKEKKNSNTPDKKTPDSEKVVARIRTAVADLDNVTYTGAGFDYWPNGGIRVTGENLVSLISLSELQSFLPCKLYVSGPHTEAGWNLESKDSFGHYNPEAIRHIRSLVEKTVDDKLFVKLTKPLVNKYLKEQIVLLWKIYRDVEKFPGKAALIKEVSERIKKGDTGGLANNGSPENSWDDVTSTMEYDESIFINTSYSFVYFWIRRNIDNSAPEIYAIINLLVKTYELE
jgi:hypothetical protein